MRSLGNLYIALLYRFFLTQNEAVDWVAVFGEKMDCFDFYNDMAYNKYLILILCIVYCL